MICTSCGVEFTDGIGSLCRKCYNRNWEKNHPCRRKINTQQCSVCGASPVVSRGLCNKHYARWLRHGSTDQTRPDTWGTIEKHPLLNQWRWMNRSNKNTVCDEWKRNFKKYTEDVGERPSKDHYLTLIDPSLPYQSGNVVWLEKQVKIKKGETAKEYARRYQRDYRKTHVRSVKNTIIKRAFGITMEQYEMMHDLQHGKCAICGEMETATIRGVSLSLAVDHCHNTGKIRGLLCHYCNKALGGFRESTSLLMKAIEYLKRNNCDS